MADYSELGTIIGHMKRAAVDAFMGEQGWIPDYEYPDRYALWGFIPSWYRRPTEDGEGGGERIAVGSDSMAPSFDSIRARIDAATSKWAGLPSGSGGSNTRDGMAAVAAQFGAAASNGTAIADGEVFKSIDTISNTVVSNVRGSFKAPFLDKYDAQFSKIVGGTGAVAAILETAFSAEKAIWPAAREDATSICVNVRNAFRVKANQSADQVGAVALTVVAAVAGVVTTIASAGTAAPIVTVMGFATTAANAIKGIDSAIDIATDSYDSIMSSLETASNDLNEAITTQERALHDMVTSTSAYIGSDLASFNLDAYVLRDFSTTDNTIELDRSEADTVLFNMDRVVETLSTAKSSLGWQTSPFTRRDGAVGLGETGPFPQIVDLQELIYGCVEATRNEYQHGRDLFSAVVEDYFATEGEAEAVSQALLRELERQDS